MDLSAVCQDMWRDVNEATLAAQDNPKSALRSLYGSERPAAADEAVRRVLGFFRAYVRSTEQNGTPEETSIIEQA